MGLITINGVPSDRFNIELSGSGTFDSPTRDIEKVSVAGRNGDLTFDNGRFENTPVRYPAFITKNFKNSIRDFEDFLGSLRGYARIEDTYHPEEFRLGIYTEGLRPNVTAQNRAGDFDIVFDCKPQRFLKSGERAVVFESDGQIMNPTLQKALPVIRVYGTGTVGIGDTTITIMSCDEYVDIDCDTMDAYKGAVNCNGDITLSTIEFPSLGAGATAIALGGDVTRVEITPRWWRA
jgi:phage-related protein